MSNTEKNRRKREAEIRDRGLDAICEYLEMDVDQMRTLDRTTLIHVMQKAKIGMAFQKEMGIAERSSESKTIRVLTLVAKDKAELKRMMRKTLPQYIPKGA